MTDSDPGFLGNDRFEVVRRLGSGGMGVVYQAFDRDHSRTVALKTLHAFSAAALYRFKREFRYLTDISHPNLVALHELISSGDQWFFTMELVEGVDFISWVRGNEAPSSPLDADETRPNRPLANASLGRPYPDASRPPAGVPAPSPLSYDRLRHAIGQLAAGVHALHQAGKLHRDIKPSNVMVDRDERVVLLDFGLVTEITRSGGGLSDGDSVVGTVDFMSPEQAASMPLGQASDWYSVGTVLYVALTGTLPFVGPPIAVLMEKQQRQPEPPGRLLPETPADLSQLCCELLRCDPSARPEGEEILRRLGSRIATSSGRGLPSGLSSQNVPLVGRAAQVAVLREAFDTATRKGRPVIALVHGRSGIGKSILIERVTHELEVERGVVVLSGRCYERESVPYKALDSLIDALSRYLAGLPRHEVAALMPRDILAVARLFPILGRLEAIEGAPRPNPAPDPQELRRRGIAGLREMLARIADRCPLVLTIDDLQWGDLDSTLLLLDLLRPPDPPGLLLVLAYRSEESQASEALSQLLQGLRKLGSETVEMCDAELGVLAPQDACALARIHLMRDRGKGEADMADAIARESAGDPFLIDQLARFARAVGGPGVKVSFGESLQAQLDELGPDARRVLELVAVAGQPVPQPVVARAAGLSRGDKVLAELRAGSLIRTSGSPELGYVEPYHDRIRAEVAVVLSDEQQSECHLALANALESSERPDPEALAVHLLSGGAVARGSEYAIEAARNASAALAFERASVLYRLAIDAMRPEEVARRRLRAALGDALSCAGRCVEAAAEYLRAAETATPAEAIEARRLAAEQLLGSGHVDDGLRELETVMQTVGMKMAATPRRAMWALFRQRVRARIRGLHYIERDASQVPTQRLSRVDICWSVAAGLVVADPIRGAEFQTRHLLLAVATGEPYRISRALAVEAGYSSLGGRRTWKRTQRVIALAHDLAGRIDEPHVRGLVAIARAMADYQTGQWAAALAGFDDAVSILRGRCTGVWFEITAALRFAVDSLFNLGSFEELCRRVPQYLGEAERRGDLYGMIDMRTGRANAMWLALDDPATARAQCALGHPHLSRSLGFSVHHYYELLAQTQIDLYHGEGEAAYRRVEQAWPVLAKSMLMRVQVIRAEALFMRGRAALAAAESMARGNERARVLVELGRTRRLLDRQKLPGARAQAMVLAAGLARLQGDVARTQRLLAQAEAGFHDADMALCAATTRYRRGEVAGGATGQQLITDSERWMRAETIRNPRAMARMMV